jgi:uncharacterized protein YdhG (YjbR/CyaY superfamily)
MSLPLLPVSQDDHSKEAPMSAQQAAKPETVDAYLADLPDDARGVLEGIREAIRRAAPDAEEGISYHIPLYKLHREHLIGFAASKHHLSLYVTDSAVLQDFQRELAEFDQAGTKTTIRFTADKPLPKKLVTRIVKARIRQLDR